MCIYTFVYMYIYIKYMFVCSFYRSVLEPAITFNSDGSQTSGPSAIFSSLPLSPLLTLNMDVPHSWMVQSIYSPYDLDNIHMASVEREVFAEYQLEYILVEGTCTYMYVCTCTYVYVCTCTYVYVCRLCTYMLVIHV